MTPLSFSSVCAALCIALLCACATQPEPSAAARRVIVTLRPGAPDPRDATFLTQLGKSTGADISVLREMSGNAWVMSVTCRADRDNGCEDALQRLRATRWIATIEPDGRERRQ